MGTLLCSYLGNCQFCYRTDLGGGGERYTITKWTHPCALGVPHPVLGLPCLQPGDYLIKELYKLKSNDLMSSLRSPSPLEYPQTHSPSFPLCPVWAAISQKQKQKSIVLLCPRYMVPKRPRMAAKPGFKSQRQSSSAAPFLTPPTIGHSCQHSRSKSGQVWPCGVEPVISKLSLRFCNQGELPPSYILG